MMRLRRRDGGGGDGGMGSAEWFELYLVTVGFSQIFIPRIYFLGDSFHFE